MFNNFLGGEGDRVVYEIMSKNIAEPARPQMTIRRMRIACWIPKATNTNTEYVLLIAFPTTTVVVLTLLTVTLYAH